MPRRARCAEQQVYPLPEPSISWNAWSVSRSVGPVPIGSRCKPEPSSRSQDIPGCHPRSLSQQEGQVAAGCSKALPPGGEGLVHEAARRRKRENVHPMLLVCQTVCNERWPATWQRRRNGLHCGSACTRPKGDSRGFCSPSSVPNLCLRNLWSLR